MRLCIMLLVSTSILLGQDSLITITGGIYLGKYIDTSENHVIFQTLDAPWPQQILLSRVKRVGISSGEFPAAAGVAVLNNHVDVNTAKETPLPYQPRPRKTPHKWAKTNVIFISVSPLLFWNVLNGYYEKLIFQPKDPGFFDSYWVRVGGGVWQEAFGGAGSNWVIGITALSGSEVHFLEANLGMVSLFDSYIYDSNVSAANYLSDYPEPVKSDYRDYHLSGGFGYRYEKPDGITVFRVGIGWPEPIYLSLGLHF